MPRINATPALNHTMLGNADKKTLLAITNAVIDDNAQLRANFNALLAKLDTAGGSVANLGTNYAATLAIAPAAVSLVK